ncbi:hypothetical protein ACHAP7_011745 [Fusarium lateritium]
MAVTFGIMKSFRHKNNITYDSELDSTNIRLVQIYKPERKLLLNKLSLQLSTHSFEEAKLLDYHALSYTWGSPEGDKQDADPSWLSILVNGEKFYPMPNLYNALIRLEEEDFEYLWIDAICIDQANEREVKTQVPIMGDIYSMAAEVYIWLGKGGKDSADAIDLIQQLSSLVPETNANEMNLVRPDDAKFEQLDLPPMHSPRWASLITLLSRNWFKRAWVMQEVALAQETFLIYGDNGMIPLVMLRDALILINRLGWAPETKKTKVKNKDKISPAGYFLTRLTMMKRLVEEAESSHRYPHLSSIEELTGTNAWRTSASPLLALLLMDFNKVNATQPPDKVYAFLGIVNVVATSMGIPRCNLEVAYRTPPDDIFTSTVFRATATKILNDCNHLGFISLAGLAETDSGTKVENLFCLPSWVPDLSDAACHARVLPIISSRGISKARWDASGYRKLGTLKFYISGSQLHVKARRVGRLLSGSYPAWNLGCKFTIEPFASLMNRCGQYYKPTGELSIEAFWRTLIFDTDIHNSPTASSGLGSCFKAWLAMLIFHHLEVWSHSIDDNLSAFERMDEYQSLAYRDGGVASDMLPSLRWMNRRLRKIQPTDHPDVQLPFKSLHKFLGVESDSDMSKELADMISQSYEYIKMFTQYSAGRRVFLTDEGHLGMSCLPATEEDSVWVISSCPVPLVLTHRVDGSYQLVGDCYVHGIMRGEAVEDNKWEDIILT